MRLFLFALRRRRFAAAAAVAAAFVVTVTAATRRAHAAPPGERVRFSWVRGDGAEACASEAVLAQRISSRLGYDPFAEQAQRFVEAVVARAGSWMARIYVRDASGALVGSRELTSDAQSCEPIEAAVALAVAIAIDPEASLSPEGGRASATASSPSAPAEPPAAPAPRPASPPVPPPERASGLARSSDLAGLVTARAGAVVGVLPRPAPIVGVGAVAGPSGSRVRATLGALWVPEGRTEDGQFGFGLTAGALGGCFLVARWSGARRPAADRPVFTGFDLCAEVYAGAMHAVPYAFTPTEPGARPWAALGASGRLEVPVVGPLLAEAGIEAATPLLRYTFRVEGLPGTVFQEPIVAGLANLGLGVSFP